MKEFRVKKSLGDSSRGLACSPVRSTLYRYSTIQSRDGIWADIFGPTRKFFCSARPGTELMYFKIFTKV